MPSARDDWFPPEDGFDRVPVGAPASEELAHEIALSAALDRSRRDLSPDPHASNRMRARFLDVLAQEGIGGTGRPTTASPFGVRPSDRLDPADLTAPIGPPIGDDLDRDAVSNRRSSGEHVPSADDAAPRSRPRRGRHVLPADHPDHPERTTAAQAAGSAGPARDTAAGPGREETERPRLLDRRRPSIRKRFGVVVGGFAALAVIAGVTSTISRDALPGDTMYGVKRAGENVGGVFTAGGQAEAGRQLDLATSRLDELESLVARATPPSPGAVSAAMDDFDRAAATGSRLILTGSGTGGADPARLSELRTWAGDQSGRISRLQAQLPADGRAGTGRSIVLLDRVQDRAEALRTSSGCAADSGGTVDDLGPVPGTCRTGSGSATTDAARQSAAVTPEGTTAPAERGTTAPPTSAAPQSSTPSSAPSTSSDPTGSSGGSGESSGAGLPLLDHQGSSSTGSSSSSSSSTPETGSSTPEDDGGGLTVPPLLPGLGPVTIG